MSFEGVIMRPFVLDHASPFSQRIDERTVIALTASFSGSSDHLVGNAGATT